MEIDISTVGGVLLVMGAALTMLGNIYRAVFTYFLADLCWLYLTYTTGNRWGLLTVSLGTLMGFIALLKMYRGLFHKTIKMDRN